MTAPAEQFPYVPRDPTLGNASLAPMLPLTLIGRQSLAATGFLDSGAAINVLGGRAPNRGGSAAGKRIREGRYMTPPIPGRRSSPDGWRIVSSPSSHWSRGTTIRW